MMQRSLTLLLVGFLTITLTVCLEAKEDESKGIDITADEELMRVGEDEQLVGQILCDIAEGWKQRAEKMSLKREDQDSEYFFKKLFRGAKKVVQGVGKAGVEIGKRFVGQKAQEMIMQKIKERGGAYAFEDAQSGENFLLGLSEEVYILGKDLIRKGVELNRGVSVKEKARDPETERFVRDMIVAF